MLERFRAAQQESVCKLQALEAKGELPAPWSGQRLSFLDALKKKGKGAVIAEYKRASPSHGSLNLQYTPEEIASAYTSAGAAALSVLTEQAHFQGDISFLARMHSCGLPLLRKDFLVHPLQVVETAATPASALLLIVRMLDDAALTEMLQKTADAGLEAVIEVFAAEDLARARQALCRFASHRTLIQVNTRNLQTLTIDDAVSRDLIEQKKPDELWISASGIENYEQLQERVRMGFDAVLVGSSLMRSDDPKGALHHLITGA